MAGTKRQKGTVTLKNWWSMDGWTLDWKTNSLRLHYTSITLLSGILKTDTKQYIDIAVNAVKCNGIHSNNVNYRE